MYTNITKSHPKFCIEPHLFQNGAFPTSHQFICALFRLKCRELEPNLQPSLGTANLQG